jgi:TonB-dependent siderophore receptor
MIRKALLVLAAVALPAWAQTPAPYAQYLVDSTLALHPELVELDVHAMPPQNGHLTLIGAKSPDRVGRPSDADDLAVFASGEPRVEINKRGDQNVEVSLTLRDIYNQTIGVVEFSFPYRAGMDEDSLLKQAAQYRDEMSRRILDAASLFEPAQLDPQVPARSYAQFLVDDTLGRHPGVEVVVLHARTSKTGTGYPIIASNIGRIGKPADASDLAVITSGKPSYATDVRGARFEAKLPLQDASGASIGAVAIIFPYKALSNRTALENRAEAISADLRARIGSTANLEEPYPSTRPTELSDAVVEYNKQELGNKQELPMTKEVVSGQALTQSTQEGYSDAVKNVAGVAPTNSAGSPNDAFSIRGIKLNLFSNYRIDGGVSIAGVITAPTEDKERVETLKGANALMFGVASPAGILNFVTKRAGPRDVTSIGYAGNSFGQQGPSVDLGRRYGADKEVGVRVNASTTHLENGVHDMGGDSTFGSIGADWRVTSRLGLQGDVEYYDRHVPEQAGISLLPAGTQGAPPGVVRVTPVPDPRNLLSGRWNEYSPRTRNVQMRADYALTESWKLLAQVGESHSHRHRGTVRIAGYNADTGANGTVTVQPITNDYLNRFYRAEALGHFRTWFLAHDLTLGFSTAERRSRSYDISNVTLAQRQNIFIPIELTRPVFPAATTTLPNQSSKDTGPYVYDAVGLTQKLKLLFGVRRTRDDEVVGTAKSTTHVNSVGYGALYDILPTTTLFASYMEGLEAGGTAPANAANANVILAPAKSKQKELGLRDSYFRGLSTSASYFEITRANAVTDPVTNIFDYNGDLKFKGVEATVRYDITRAWSVNGAMLRLQAVQDAKVQPLIDGKTPENTPKWNLNAGLAYRVPSFPGLTLRGGLRYISKRPVNPQDQGYIDGYTLYDAGASYATRTRGGERVSFQLSVDNLSNKRYWNSVQTGTYGIGMDRAIRFSARMDY